MSLSEAQRAIESLQKRALRTSEGYAVDVIDRALDEIVRNYDNPSPAPWQIRSALANAAKVVQFRREVVATVPFDDPNRTGFGADDDKFAAFELRDWLDRTPVVNEEERQLLVSLADGGDAELLARTRDVPVARMRERISRARARARVAYAADIAA